jgi:stress response protein YsnF
MGHTEAGRLVVVDDEGRRGTCEPFADGADLVWITFDEQRIRFPAAALQEEADGSYRLPLRLSQYLGAEDVEAVIVPVLAERASLRAVERETGRVRVTTTVHEDEEDVTASLKRQTVAVERVPVNREVDGIVKVRREGDTLIIPVLEEVLVVEKKLVLKEEVHVTTSRTEREVTERVTLRREEVDVERIAATEEDEQ